MDKMRISEDQFRENKPIPVAMLPKRYAVATNLLCAIDIAEDRGPGLLVLNYEPEKWNQWFPFYSTINDLTEFSSTRFGDLRAEFARIVDSFVGTPQDRLTKAKKEFKDLYVCGDIEIDDQPIVEPETWLRFSKTQNIWTYYFVEFFCATHIEKPEGLAEQNRIQQALLPIDPEPMGDFLQSGLLEGVPVVDNTVALLSNEEALARIRENIIRAW